MGMITPNTPPFNPFHVHWRSENLERLTGIEQSGETNFERLLIARQKENERDYLPDYRDIVRFHTGRAGISFERPLGVVITGLRSAPGENAQIINALYDDGANVICLSLPGHFNGEVDHKAFKLHPLIDYVHTLSRIITAYKNEAVSDPDVHVGGISLGGALGTLLTFITPVSNFVHVAPVYGIKIAPVGNINLVRNSFRVPIATVYERWKDQTHFVDLGEKKIARAPGETTKGTATSGRVFLLAEYGLSLYSDGPPVTGTFSVLHAGADDKFADDKTNKRVLPESHVDWRYSSHIKPLMHSDDENADPKVTEAKKQKARTGLAEEVRSLILGH